VNSKDDTDRRRRRSKATKGHEDRIASRLGGRRISGSGAGALSSWQRAYARMPMVVLNDAHEVMVVKTRGKVETAKGDIDAPGMHVEHKRTEKRSISLKLEWLEKVSEGADRIGKDPAVVITFEGPKSRYGKHRYCRHRDWAVVPIGVLERLLKAKQ